MPEVGTILDADRGSPGSCLCASPTASSRTRVPSLSPTSSTRAAADRSHWASGRSGPPVPSAAQVHRSQSGAEVNSFAVEPILDPRLREKSYGEAEGRPQPWLDMRFVPPPAVGERLAHDEGVKGAETRAAWVHRVYVAMEEILQRPCGHQIIVTHGGTLTPVVAA
jgi:probable phosphoglycerate mutase